MKTKLILAAAGIAVLAFLAGRFVAPSPTVSAEASSHSPSPSSPTTWTCSMHPQIQQTEPGQCPICGMDLIPVKQEDGNESGPREMSMSEASRALAEIQTSEVVRAYPEAKISLVGKLAYDETLVKSLTARFPARIDELFVNFTGIRVKKGEHLANVYSPELLTAQRELLSAYRADPESSITRVARKKLLLWDLLPEQIDAIIESGEAKDSFVMKAPIGGVVVEKHIKEGDYVKTGEPLFRIVDLSELWAELSAYESDLAWLRFGQKVSFTVESFPGESFQGQINFIEPEVNRDTRTVPIRVHVSNKNGHLKPGMFVRAVVASRIAEDGKVDAPDFTGKWISPMHPEIIKDGPGQCDVCGMDLVPAEKLGYVEKESTRAPLIVPTSAVLRTGKRSVVYVAQPDKERPTYEGREIVLGPRAGDHFVVASGLKEGEQVVTKGAFKIDSALQIQAKPSMMNPGGGGPAPKHTHGNASGDSDTQASGKASDAIEVPTAMALKLIEPYLAMQAALAGDELEPAKKQAEAMMAITGHSGELPQLIHDMLKADTLDAFRKPYFDRLSAALIAAIGKSPKGFSENLMIMHCPMVYGETGADWLQNSKPLQNPYFGASMLGCGEIKKEVSEMKLVGSTGDTVNIDADTAKALIADYLKLQSALAADDLDASKQALKAMMSITGHSGNLPELLHTMLNAESLDAIRRPHFEKLSNALIAAAQKMPTMMPDKLMIMHCPMVYDDRGADWLQASKPLQNPYFGASMLGCGEIRETLKPTQGAQGLENGEIDASAATKKEGSE